MGARRKTIGIVLAKMPGYSETFLTTKVVGLKEAGFDVIVFANKGPKSDTLPVRQVTAFILPMNAVLRVLKTYFVLIYLLFRCPGRVIRLYKLEKRDGVTGVNLIKSIFIAAHILEFRLDWLHFGFSTLAVGRENVAKAIGARMACSLRGYDVSIFPLKNTNVYNKVWARLDKIHTISLDLYNQALQLGLSTSVPVVKIQPAIDVSKFRYEGRSFENKDVLYILTIARLQWKKGLEVALDAMRTLKLKGIPFQYTIVGTGPENERLLFSRYQNDLVTEVVFKGRISHEDVAAEMKKHDVYIQPSLQEGFCNAVLEAQASGLLCIVSDAEGLPENVIQEETGWVVPKWDSEILADRIIEVSNLPLCKRKSIVSNAITRVKNEFSLADQQKQFAAFFQ